MRMKSMTSASVLVDGLFDEDSIGSVHTLGLRSLYILCSVNCTVCLRLPRKLVMHIFPFSLLRTTMPKQSRKASILYKTAFALGLSNDTGKERREVPRARPFLAAEEVEDGTNTNQTAAEQDSFPAASTSQTHVESKKRGKKRSSVSKKQMEKSKSKVRDLALKLLVKLMYDDQGLELSAKLDAKKARTESKSLACIQCTVLNQSSGRKEKRNAAKKIWD